VKRGGKAAKKRGHSVEGAQFEAEVLPGLEPIAAAELAKLAGVGGVKPSSGAVGFRYAGPLAALARLRTVVAVYRVLAFAVPRPKALLGDEHFRKLLLATQEVCRASKTPFHSFRLSAAGRGSSVFQRLAAAFRDASGLADDPEEGDLFMRVRKARGWEVLLRLTPRPLSARSWRVCNRAGGLNATLAAAVWRLLSSPGERVLNAMCGSGTLLIERPRRSGYLVGVDIDPEALACVRENLRAASLGEVELLQADATALPFSPASFDVVVADLPWGDAVGSHQGNAVLYPAFLAEMARLLAPGGELAVITHEVRLFERLLAAAPGWQVERQLKVFHGGHYPRLYLLRRT
jgi:SAM-dependent methyltransferase